MAEPGTNGTNGSYAGASHLRLKLGLAEMLKGGVIMDVMNVEQARIAEEAGAVAVMALERVPAMIRAEGGVARMANPKLVKRIIETVSIPVMAKARIGHFAEAQVLQYLGVDFIDESEVLTPADETHHIDKHAFTTPFVCGARDLGEALRRISEGAAMIRTKGEAGTGDVVHAVKHMRQIVKEMKALTVLGEEELYAAAKEHRAPYELIRMVAKTGKLPVPNFSAGGIATPADAALMMQLGAEAVFVGSGIFMKERATPARRRRRQERARRSRVSRQSDRHRDHSLRQPEDSRREQRRVYRGDERTRGRCARRVAVVANARLVNFLLAETIRTSDPFLKSGDRLERPLIGVLAIQGDYAAHARALIDSGGEPVMVRTPEELAGLDGLIIPGGESTTMLRFLERDGFLGELKKFVETNPAFGTCAGCILLAKEVLHPAQASLSVLNATVERNAYGRQIDSAILAEETSLPGGPLEMVFIRAPRLTRVGDDVEVLADREGFPS